MNVIVVVDVYVESMCVVSVSNVSVSSQSRLLTSRLHRISKFKLRTITIKFSLYRDTWAAYVSEQFNNTAMKNMNVMDVIKAWFTLISASGTTNNVSNQKVHDYYRFK